MKYWRTPLDVDKLKVPRGKVQILKERCKGCSFCVEFCPQEVLSVSEEFNAKGYHPPQVDDGRVCVSCGLCEMLCPEFAIYVLEEEVEVRDQ